MKRYVFALTKLKASQKPWSETEALSRRDILTAIPTVELEFMSVSYHLRNPFHSTIQI